MDKNEHVKEVYAHFGLTMYLAQVFEHAIVNSFIFLELIPKTKGKWTSEEFDSYMNGEFDKTLGWLISKLRNLMKVSDDSEEFFINVLKKRNWLAHDYFRERAEQFMSSSGRDFMIQELRRHQELFEKADKILEDITGPLRRKFGITDEKIEQSMEDFKKRARSDL